MLGLGETGAGTEAGAGVRWGFTQPCPTSLWKTQLSWWDMGSFVKTHPPLMYRTRGSSQWLHLFADISLTASAGPHAHSLQGPKRDY